MGKYEKKKRLKFGRIGEINFLKDLRDIVIYHDYKIKFHKHNSNCARIDFYTSKMTSNKCVNIELKSRRLNGNNIVLFVNYSKLKYVKEFRIKYVYLIWKIIETNEYYYLFLTPTILEYLLGIKTINCFEQRTIIVDVELTKKTKNLLDIVNEIEAIYNNDDPDVYEDKIEDLMNEIIIND